MENSGERIVTMEQLHEKEVINIMDGKRLGYPCDVQMDLCDGKIIAVTVPSGGGFMGIGGRREDIVIPWENIEKIGKDIILVKCRPSPKCDCERENEYNTECKRKKKFFS